MKALKISALFIFGFLPISFSYGDYSVSRSPSQYEVTTPVQYSFGLTPQDYYDEIGGYDGSIDNMNFICFTGQDYSLDYDFNHPELSFIYSSPVFQFDSISTSSVNTYDFTIPVVVGNKFETIDYWLFENEPVSCQYNDIVATAGAQAGSAVEFINNGVYIFEFFSNQTATTTINIPDYTIYFDFILFFLLGGLFFASLYSSAKMAYKLLV